MDYHIYSDASYREGYPTGYAFLIRTFYRDQWQDHSHRSGLISSVKNSFDAEVLSLIEALKTLPSQSHGYCHTDMVQLPPIIEYAHKTRRKCQDVIWALRRELDRTGLKICYEPPNARPREYQWCHNQARRAQRNSWGAVRAREREAVRRRRSEFYNG